MSTIVEIKDPEDFEEKVLKADGVKIVKFTAPWCGPCKQMKPVDEQVSGDDVEILYVNIDDDALNAFAKSKFGIRGVPTYIPFKDGEQGNGVLVGANSRAKLEELANQ